MANASSGSNVTALRKLRAQLVPAVQGEMKYYRKILNINWKDHVKTVTTAKD